MSNYWTENCSCIKCGRKFSRTIHQTDPPPEGYVQYVPSCDYCDPQPRRDERPTPLTDAEMATLRQKADQIAEPYAHFYGLLRRALDELEWRRKH